MERKSIIQEYYALAVDKNGNMPPMHRDETYAGLVVAGLMDLLLNDVIRVENSKIAVIGKLPEEFEHLSGLYEYLNEKKHMTIKLMSDFSVGKRINQLIVATGKSLLDNGIADIGDGGIFVNRDTYIPHQKYKDELIRMLKASTLETCNPTQADVALVCILKKSNSLIQYFSKEEEDKMKEKLEELKKDPQYAKLIKMVDYVRNMSLGFLGAILLMGIL